MRLAPPEASSQSLAASTNGPDAAAFSERLRRADLRATTRRLLILDVIASLPQAEVNAVAVLKEIYARGVYIPLPSIYRILRELKRRGVVDSVASI
jgi:Fe2+ or Zn2+ uptake regulation protein